MANKFRVNDIIISNKGGCFGIVVGYDNRWYYVTWVDGGDSMLYIENADESMEKVGEYTPGSADDILLYGKMKV